MSVGLRVHTAEWAVVLILLLLHHISCLSHYEPTLRGFTATTYWTIRPKASPRHNTDMYYTNTRPRYYLKLEDFGGAADFSFSEWTTDISLFTLRAYATGSSNDK